MRFAFASFALVAVFHCLSLKVSCEDGPPDLMAVAAKKATEEAVATPISEFMKDMYDLIIRQKGSRLYRRLRYKMAGVLLRNEPLDLSRFIMQKLKQDVFNGQVNDKMFEVLTMELYYALKEFFETTPEDPKEAADLGVWHGLVNLYKEVMAPALRGSERLGRMSEILLDPELGYIRRAVAEYKGVPLPKRAAVRSAVSGQAKADSTSTKDGSEVN